MIDLDAETLAETAAFVAQIDAAAATMPPSHVVPVEEQRAAMASGAEPAVAHAHDEQIAGVPVRVLEPPDARGTYLHLHGGGWTMGSNAWQDQRLWRLAVEAGVPRRERRVPTGSRAPVPGGVRGLPRRRQGARRRNVVIGGESAGAHLSALVLTELRSGFRGANLVYGCFDLGMSPSQRGWGERQLILSTPTIRWHLDQLLPDRDDEARRHPSISPLFADLAGMPPALLTVGTADPLLDDSVLLAARWPGATLDVYAGGFHAFDFFPLRMAEIASLRQIGFVRTCIGSA